MEKIKLIERLSYKEGGMGLTDVSLLVPEYMKKFLNSTPVDFINLGFDLSEIRCFSFNKDLSQDEFLEI